MFSAEENLLSYCLRDPKTRWFFFQLWCVVLSNLLVCSSFFLKLSGIEHSRSCQGTPGKK